MPAAKPTAGLGLSSMDEATLQKLSTAFMTGFTTSQYNEHAYAIEPGMVTGRIPRELCGTLLRNGPGLFEIGDTRITQPFDGDGMVCSFAFKDGNVFFRNKFVRTENFIAEQRAGKPLYRSAFNRGALPGSWLFNPFDFNVKSIANTNVIHWGNKTLALHERGMPQALDVNLATVGPDNLGGAIDDPEFFGAHFRVVTPPGGGPQRLVAFRFSESGTDGAITVWEFDDDFKCLHKTKRKLKGAAFGFFHDFAITENHYVFVENPIRMNYGKLFTKYTLGRACLAECLEFDSTLPVRFHIIPRPGMGQPSGPEHMRVFVLRDDPVFTFHHSNAFELQNGRYIVIDSCSSRNIDFGNTVENTSLAYYQEPRNRDESTRFVVDTHTGTVARHVIAQRNADFPSINTGWTGRPTRHQYLYGSLIEDPGLFSPPQALWKVSMPPELGVGGPLDRSQVQQALWSPGPDKVAQEPVFVARPGATEEDDGWVLVMVFDCTKVRTSLAILDAQDIKKGPVATVHLPHHIPLGLHGTFTKQYLGPSKLAATNRVVYNIKNGV